ncbi:MAG TPA: DUF2510 domain-containing protein, partial [Solirubrobacteraceae bacterium]|nr:DUF2510 domain-containing protein [Solirubrobacteraceae bacterium]
MAFLRHDSDAGPDRPDQRLARVRGAWYPDPYGSPGQDRFYDGGKWTEQVRDAGGGDAPTPPRLRLRPARARAPAIESPPRVGDEPRVGDNSDMDREIAHTPREEPQPNNTHPNDFPVRMADVVGERLRFRRCEPRESHIHELMSMRGRVGSVSLLGSSRLALVACAEGSVSLTKRRQFGWQLLIRRPDGKNLGLYSGRRWLSGGTIILTSGVEVGLEHGV